MLGEWVEKDNLVGMYEKTNASSLGMGEMHAQSTGGAEWTKPFVAELGILLVQAELTQTCI